MLLIVFGTLVAAGMPLGVGALAVLGGFAATFLLARFTDVSPYATYVVSMIGPGWPSTTPSSWSAALGRK